MANQPALHKAILAVRVDRALRKSFLDACRRRGLDGTTVVTRLMNELVDAGDARPEEIAVSLEPMSLDEEISKVNRIQRQPWTPQAKPRKRMSRRLTSGVGA